MKAYPSVFILMVATVAAEIGIVVVIFALAVTAQREQAEVLEALEHLNELHVFATQDAHVSSLTTSIATAASTRTQQIPSAGCTTEGSTLTTALRTLYSLLLGN